MLSKYFYLCIVLNLAMILSVFGQKAMKHTKINTDGDYRDIFSSTFQMQLLLKAELEFVNYLKRNKDVITNSTQWVNFSDILPFSKAFSFLI